MPRFERNQTLTESELDELNILAKQEEQSTFVRIQPNALAELVRGYRAGREHARNAATCHQPDGLGGHCRLIHGHEGPHEWGG
jgi:hypothetical protein